MATVEPDRRDGCGSPANGWWAAFLFGVTAPSWQAVSIAVAINLMLVAVCVTGIRPWTMAFYLAPYLAQNSYDDDTYVTCGALALNQEDRGGPIVVLIGASSIRASVFEGKLARRIELATGIKVPVYKLATGQQTYWESAALAGMVPDGARGVVVLGVGAYRLRYGKEMLPGLVTGPRLGFYSEAFESEMRFAGVSPAWRTGNYFIDNRLFLLPRLPFLIVRGVQGRVRSTHRYLGKPVADDTEWYRAGDMTDALFSDSGKAIEMNLAIISRMVKRLKRDTRMSLAFLVPPVNSRYLREYGREELYHRSSERVERFAEAHGAEYWDLRGEAGLTESDFWDWCHLRNASAIDRHTRVLSERVIALLDGPQVR